jgi:uncharacterized protein
MLIIIFFIIYTIFFKKSTPKSRDKSSKKSTPSGDIMIECSNCQTFVAEDEAIIKDGKFYCSKSCAGVK